MQLIAIKILWNIEYVKWEKNFMKGNVMIMDKLFMKIVTVVHSDGHEVIKKYDEDNNLIYYKDYNSTYEYKYDDKGNETYYKLTETDTKEPTIYEEWKEYDDYGNIIHYKDSFNYEQWWEYNQDGNLIKHRNSKGHEGFYEYNENGEIVYSKDIYGNETRYYYKHIFRKE